MAATIYGGVLIVAHLGSLRQTSPFGVPETNPYAYVARLVLSLDPPKCGSFWLAF